MKRAVVVILFVCAAAAWLYVHSSGDRLEDVAAQRPRALESTIELPVALVWPQGEASSLYRGAALAVWEVNQQGGVLAAGPDGPLRRPLQLLAFDESDNPAGSTRGTGPEQSGLQTARELAMRSDLLAVIGHHTDTAASAAIVYQRAGLLFLAPAPGESLWPRRDASLVFRIGPMGRQLSTAMIEAIPRLATPRAIRAAVLFPSRSDGVDLAAELAAEVNALAADRAGGRTLDVVVSGNYEPGRREHRQLVQTLIDELRQCELVVLADVSPEAALLRQAIQDELAAISGSESPSIPIVTFDALGDDVLKLVDSGPDERHVALRAAASLLLRQSRLRIAILTSRTPFGRQIHSWLDAGLDLQSRSAGREMELVVCRSIDPDPADQAELVASVLRHAPDIIVLADRGPSATALLDRLREEGYDRPILCPPDLESTVLPRRTDPTLMVFQERLDAWAKANLRGDVQPLMSELTAAGFVGTENTVRRYVAEHRGGTHVVTAIDPREVPGFAETFQDRFGRPADAEAALGYLAVRLLVNGCEQADSLDPRLVAHALRHRLHRDDALKQLHFSDRNELLGFQFTIRPPPSSSR